MTTDCHREEPARATWRSRESPRLTLRGGFRRIDERHRDDARCAYAVLRLDRELRACSGVLDRDVGVADVLLQTRRVDGRSDVADGRIARAHRPARHVEVEPRAFDLD